MCPQCPDLLLELKGGMDNAKTNECGCVPLKLPVRTWRFEFHVIFMCHGIVFFWLFFLNTKKCWHSSYAGPIQKQAVE